MTPTEKGRRIDALYQDSNIGRIRMCEMIVNREADMDDLRDEIYGLQCEIGRLEEDKRSMQDKLDLALDSKRIAERRVTGLTEENDKLRAFGRKVLVYHVQPDGCPACEMEARQLGIEVAK